MLQGRIEPGTEARREARQMTVLMNAALVQDGHDGLCRIRNVSEGGLAVETSLNLAVDQPVQIVLRSGHSIACTVRWVRDGRAGMSSEEDVAALILAERAAHADDKPLDPALPRFVRRLPITLNIHGLARAAVLHSLSTSDAIVFGAPVLEVGQALGITIPGLGTHPAVAVARAEDELLAAFKPPLPFRLLDSWLAETGDR